jgi:uncharacterized protein YbjT (DUF2867 family)
MKALIIGSTGLTGSYCLESLLNDSDYKAVEIWVRNFTGRSDPKLKETPVNFEKLNEIEKIDADHVFCCLGTTIKKAGNKNAFTRVDKDYVIEIAKLAEKSDCKKFLVISSIGADISSSNFYLKTKGEMEEEVKKHNIPAIFIMRPSMLLGKRKEFRFGEVAGRIVLSVVKYLLVGKLKKYRGIEAEKVAKAMIFLAKGNIEGISIMESDEIAGMQL